MPGDGEVQALLSDVEARGSFADKRGQRHAGRAVQRRHARHPTGIHTHARQLAACQAGGQTVTPGIGLEGDVPGGHKTIVEINIDAIGAWRNLGLFQIPTGQPPPPDRQLKSGG